jgi:hypothetical protein
MITDMNARVAMAQKLSIPQLQQAIKNGTIPAYVGVPMLQDKMRQQQQMQMAAAQQQQGQQGQQQRPIAEEVMEQAGAMGGVDQLPSNLPIQNEEDDENYAGGGIIAFRDGNQVQDPDGRFDEMSTIDRIREENPELYSRMFPQEGPPLGVNADTRDYSGNAQEGSGIPQLRDYNQRQLMADLPGGRLNVPGINPSTPRERVNQGLREEIPNPPDAFINDPGYDPVPASPLRRFVKDKLTGAKDEFNTLLLRDKLIAPYISAASGLGDASDQEMDAARTMIGRIGNMSGPELRSLSGQGRIPAVAAVETTTQPTPQPAPQVQPVRNEADYSMNLQDGTGRLAGDMTAPPTSNAGITNIPGASSPAQRGAPPPSATSSGAVSPDVARQISATNPGAPATLKDAERQAASGSPQASAAVSMLDKYVAMLEKSGDDVGRQKKEALYMALIQGGLGMMGGTSPNAFANISAGLLPATQAYQQAIAGIRKDDRARLEKLISTGLKKEEFLLKAEEIGVKRENARLVYDAAMARTGAMAARGSGSSSLDEKREAETFIRANGVLARARKDFNTATADQTYKFNQQLLSNPKAKPEDRKRAQTYIDSINNQYLPAIQEAQEIVNLYRPPNMQTSGGASNVLPMPGSKGELKTGGVYNTARGPAKWDGNQFVSVK